MGKSARHQPSGTVGPHGSPSWLVTGAAFSAVLLLILITYAGTSESIINAWVSSNLYSHGFLVVPAVAYLLWRRRRVLAEVSPVPFAFGLLGLVGAGLVWLLGETTTTDVFKHLGLVLMLQAAALTLLGWRVFWIARFPLAYLFFTVPFGAGLIPPLQTWTAEIVTAWLQGSGISAHLTGHRIVTPAGAFYIAEACAGARFLISAVAIGVFAADLFYRQTWRKILLIGLSIGLPVVANALRAYGIIVIAVRFGRDSGVMVDHITYGLVFLSLVILAILGLGLIFRESAALSGPRAPDMAASRSPRTWSLSLLLALTLPLTVGPALLASRGDLDSLSGSTRPPTLRFDPPGTWQTRDDVALEWQPKIQGPDGELRQSFASEGAAIVLYVAYFRTQRQGAEVVNEENRVAGSLFSQVTEARSQALEIDGRSTEVPCQRLATAPTPLRLCYWYWVDNRFTGSALMAKLYQASARLRGHQSAAIVAVATPQDDAGEARRIIQGFLRDVAPLNTVLRGIEQE